MNWLRPWVDAFPSLSCGPSNTARLQINKPWMELKLKEALLVSLTQRESLMNFFFPVVSRKTIPYSDLSHQIWCHAPIGFSIDTNWIKPESGSEWSLLWSCSSQRLHPQGNTVAYWSPSLSLENSRASHVSIYLSLHLTPIFFLWKGVSMSGLTLSKGANQNS